MAQGLVDAACARFAESQRLDASSGTLLNLGECYRKQAKIATAWATFLAAAQLAQAQGRPDRSAVAQKLANDLERKLSYLTLRVQTPVDKLEVRRGDVVQEIGSWGARSPVDPGDYEIVARAPGYQAFRTTVRIENTPGDNVVTIPNLQATPTQAPTPAAAGPDLPPLPQYPVLGAAAADSGGENRQRLWAYAAGGVGLLGLGIGTYYAFLWGARKADTTALSQECDGRTESADPCGSAEQQRQTSLITQTQGAGTGAAVGLVAGGALLATGVVLFFTAPRQHRAAAPGGLALRFAPAVSANSAFIRAEGVW